MGNLTVTQKIKRFLLIFHCEIRMIHPNAPDTLAGKLTVRSVFVIDPEKKVRMIETYPASTGRNFEEVIRVLDSLQIADRFNCATPANWRPGNDVVISPSVTDEKAIEQFGSIKTIKPYLRYVADPTSACVKRKLDEDNNGDNSEPKKKQKVEE